LRLSGLHKLRDLGRLFVKRPVSDGYMVEHIEMFSPAIPDGITPQNQDGEVMGFECVSIDDLFSAMRDGRFTFEAR